MLRKAGIEQCEAEHKVQATVQHFATKLPLPLINSELGILIKQHALAKLFQRNFKNQAIREIFEARKYKCYIVLSYHFIADHH